jgi:hypothetical protein
MKKMTSFRRFMFVLVALLLCASTALAQEKSDELFASYSWGVPERPFNCEINFQRLERVRNMLRGQTNQRAVVIILARLGDGEKRRGLNRRRLNNVREGLSLTLSIEPERIVIGEGERVRGYGRVEFYLGGALAGALLVKKNGAVIKCDF